MDTKRIKWFQMVLLIGCVLSAAIATTKASPYATEVISSNITSSDELYNDPNAVLGQPTTKFHDSFSFGGVTSDYGVKRVKLVASAYNLSPEGNNLITTLSSGDHIIVKFDHQVENDPNNPFGIDLLIFGNQWYGGPGVLDDDTNMNEYILNGTLNSLGQIKVSVSQDGNVWHDYNDGPYADGGAFPTQAYQWDAVNAQWTDEEMDYTKPVNPDLAATLHASGRSAADAIADYDGSAGGTGFDIGGFDLAINANDNKWIQYVKVEGTVFGGQIDGFSDVAATPEPTTLCLLGLGFTYLIRKRSRRS